MLAPTSKAALLMFCLSFACPYGGHALDTSHLVWITSFTNPLPSWLTSRPGNDTAQVVDFGTREVVTEPVKSPCHPLYALLRPYPSHPGPITPARTVLAS